MIPAELLRQISALANTTPADLLTVIAGQVARIKSPSVAARQAVCRLISPAGVQAQVVDLFEAWQTEAPHLSPEAVSLALRAAALTAEEARQKTQTALVWTGPAVPGSSLRRTDQALLQVINNARHTLLIVSFAVYKIPQICHALVTAAGRRVSIALCLEAPDPGEGKIAYDTIRALGAQVAQNAAIYIWPAAKRPCNEQGKHGSLHVKCAVADRRHLFISSANLTGYALTLNMELGVLIEGGDLPESVAEHFSRLIEDGVLVLVC